MFKFHGILRASPSGQAKKILEYLLYLFVFLLPWQTRWIIYNPLINGGVWEYGRISVYSFDLVFLALALFAFAASTLTTLQPNWTTVDKKTTAGRRLPITNCQLLIISLFLYYFITILFISDYKLISFYWSLRILQGVLLIWLLSRINFSKIKLAWVFVSGVTLSAMLGIYQFLTQSAFASKWLGLAYHSAANLGDSVIETADGRWLRAYGSFPHPNVLAGFIVLAIILCIWLISQKTQKAQKAQKAQKTQKALLLYYFITLLLITSLFFTFSRAAWIAFFVLGILYFVLSIKKKLVISNWKLLFFSLFIVSCLLLIIYWPLVKNRILDEQRLEVKSNIERVSGYQESFEIIKNNLLLGVGIGNYTVELQKIKPGLQAWDYQPAHNVYLLVLAEVGIIGLIIIVILSYCYIAKYKLLNCQIVKLLKNNFYTLLVTGYTLLFLFDHFWWTLPSGMLVVFLAIAVFVTQAFRPDKRQGYLSASGGKA